PDGDADHDALADPLGAGQIREPVDLVEGVQDDPADPGVQGPGQLRDRLVVAVEPDPLRRHAGGQRHGQLPAGADVQVQPFLGDDAHDRLAQEGLAGVVDVRAGERVVELPAAPPEVLLVEDVRRGAVLGGEVAHRDAAYLQRPVRAPAYG